MMNYDLPEVPSLSDVKAVIGNRVPFLSKNLSTLIEIRRMQTNKSVLGLIGKDEYFKGVSFIDDLFKVTNVSKEGVVTFSKNTGVMYLNGEALYASILSNTLADFSDTTPTFAVILSYSTEFYRDNHDDSPVIGLEETVARQRIVFSLDFEEGIGVQDTLSWGSTNDANAGKILLCQITNFTGTPQYTDKRYFSGIPYFNVSRFTNLYNILDNLKYLDPDGITERNIVTEEVPQMPLPISVYSKRVVKDASKGYSSLADKVILREAAVSSLNNSEVAIVKLIGLSTQATTLGSDNFEAGMEHVEGKNDSTTPEEVRDPSQDFVSLGIEENQLVYNLTSRAVGSIATVTTNTLTLTGITFAQEDEYVIPIGDLSKAIELNYYSGKISLEERTALYEETTLANFLIKIGDEGSGLISNREVNKEVSSVRLSQLEADLREEFEASSIDPKYSLVLTWEEPTLQEDGETPLTQDIVSAMIRVIKVNKLSNEEIAEITNKNTIDTPIVTSRRITDDMFDIATKAKTGVNIYNKAYFEEIPAGKVFTFSVKWDSSYIIYIAPVTEYGVVGKWKSIYIDVEQELINGKTVEDDYKESVQINRKKEEVMFSAYTRKVAEQQFEVEKEISRLPSLEDITAMIKTTVEQETQV